MKKLLFIFLFICSVNSYGSPVVVDNCTFTVASTINLTTSNTACETGGTTWTVAFNDSAVNIQANSAGYAAASGADVDKTNLLNAPGVLNLGLGQGGEVSGNFIDGGTIAAEDSWFIFIGGTDGDNQYLVGSVDDNNTAYRVYKWVGSPTSLGTFGGFQNGANENITLRVKLGKGLWAYEAGVASFASTDTSISSITRAGLGCGDDVVATEDCGTGNRMDNFFAREWRQRFYITSWIEYLLSPAEAHADDMPRDGKWMVSTVIEFPAGRGTMGRMAKIGQYPECRYSSVIGDTPVPDEYALSYVTCTDYTQIEQDPDIQVLWDENSPMGEQVKTLPARKRSELMTTINNKMKSTVNENLSVEQAIEALGRKINPDFEVKKTYAR